MFKLLLHGQGSFPLLQCHVETFYLTAREWKPSRVGSKTIIPEKSLVMHLGLSRDDHTCHRVIVFSEKSQGWVRPVKVFTSLDLETLMVNELDNHTGFMVSNEDLR